jgi:hypothetical protein
MHIYIHVFIFLHNDLNSIYRGSRQPNFKIAKNVVRYIRYRLAVRTKIQAEKPSTGKDICK